MGDKGRKHLAEKVFDEIKYPLSQAIDRTDFTGGTVITMFHVGLSNGNLIQIARLVRGKARGVGRKVKLNEGATEDAPALPDKIFAKVINPISTVVEGFFRDKGVKIMAGIVAADEDLDYNKVPEEMRGLNILTFWPVGAGDASVQVQQIRTTLENLQKSLGSDGPTP